MKSYWSQFDISELNEMQGIREEEEDLEENSKYIKEDECFCLMGCSNCLF